MRKILNYIVIGVISFLIPKANIGQTAPNLNTANRFVLFTITGAFNSTSPSTIVVGNVGNGAGAVSAFPPGLLAGDKHFGDVTATQVGNDISAAYADLGGRVCGFVHPVGFGNGEVLSPGVHCAGAASTLTGNVTLDAAGNSSAVFIININGAFSSVAGAQIILTNGASACNVFWRVNGAVTLINTVFKGTLIAAGDINLNTNTILDGRAFATAGALAFGPVIVSICDAVILPLQLINFEVAKTRDNNVQISWITAAEVNVLDYEVQASINGSAFFTVGTTTPKGNSLPTRYSLEDQRFNKSGVRFYRLKMVDKDGSITYSAIRSIKFSDLRAGLVNIFPNPAGNKINITANSEDRDNIIVTIANMEGQVLLKKTRSVDKGINNLEEDIHNLSTGTYIVSLKSVNNGQETRQKLQKL